MSSISTSGPADDDLVIERDGAVAVIDSVSQGFLDGSVIDFVDDLIGPVLQDHEPQRHVVLRLRHQFLDLSLRHWR